VRKDTSVPIDAVVAAEIKDDGAKTGKGIVQVIVTARDGATQPNGTIARVTVHMLKDAKGPEKVKLSNVARASSAGTPATPIEPVAGKDGEIDVLAGAPSVIACFFYMH
jgi:hypothetical protein